MQIKCTEEEKLYQLHTPIIVSYYIVLMHLPNAKDYNIQWVL